MIIWVNGAFGSGKTTLVAELHRRLPDALVYDPELTGFLLRSIPGVPAGDFQDLALWRRQVADLALGLAGEYGKPVLVPMTLVEPRYADEIFGAFDAAGAAVRHFFLDVPAAELERRLRVRVVNPDDPERDEAVRKWCEAQIPRCAAAVITLRAGTVLLDGCRPTYELADEVLARSLPGN
ncbi:AAA family ATPase [Streptomyces finlayi]|uniref:AAA family ATPase n=1 Tax=Streptomyces finlayi TaxID=67296 RepID=A0A7G7BER3_9ACTN|nr:AAA family ATPase [Streptomyces finlayi]QNE73828.1 AAA family ATPase [Streptomyces finlayi]